MIPEILNSQVGIGSKKPARDHVSAHRIALLALIKEFCMVKNKNRTKSEQKDKENPKTEEKECWVQTNRQKRDFAISVLKYIQNPDVELKELLKSVLPIMHPKTYEQFLKGLKELRDSGVASIMDFLQSLEVLLVEPQNDKAIVHKSSVLGLFIRRMLLTFDKLSFSNVVKLHKSFSQYYDSAFKKDKDDISDEANNDSDSDNPAEFNQILASQKQTEFFISQQASLFQINEQEAYPPAELQKKIEELLRGNPDFAEAHYLSYLNSLRVKEYLGAVKSLHHYFDRCTSLTPETKPPASTNSDDVNRSFRYAALNLGILHAKFGHKDEALAALKEAIRTAQEASDNTCLQHALSWLYHLTPQNHTNLIERSISKAGELNLWYLSSIGVQALAQSKALSGLEPAEVFEMTMKSDILNCHHSISELLGPAYAQKASLWYLYGNSSLADLCSQILLYMNTMDPSKGRVYHIGEGTCLALRNLAWNMCLKGQYNVASSILLHARNIFPAHSDNSAIWMQCEETIVFERALLLGRWQDAEKSISGISIFDANEGKLRRAELNFHMGNYESVHSLIKELLLECKKELKPSPHFHVRILLLRAKLYIQCHQMAQALSPLTLALTLCEENHLQHLRALVRLHMAAIQYLTGQPGQALYILERTFIPIQAHGNLNDIAQLQVLYAKCLVADESKSKDNAKRQESLKSAVGFLKKAEQLFTIIESFHRARDTLYWQAMFYNELGDVKKRNQCSLSFRKLEEKDRNFTKNSLMVP